MLLHRCLPLFVVILLCGLFGAHRPAAKTILSNPARPAADAADPLKEALNTAIAKVRPALVRIHVVSVVCANGREVKEEGYGSGVIISRDGYVITNHHVAGNARQITCTLASREDIDAELIGTDALSDLAILRLTAKKRTFPYAVFGDSAALRVGDRIFAMGSPLAFSQSVTMGVVSNTELILPEIFGEESFLLDGEDVGSLIRWIAHDAQIFPGNSGGPLVNARGEIVGINEISVGLGAAIPGNQARDIAASLIKSGRVSRSWLGMAIQPLLRTSAVPRGVLIADVEPGSPAAAGGLQSGDVLTQLAGQPVDIHYKEDIPLFNQRVMGLHIGKPVTIRVMRNGAETALTVTPSERQNARERSEEVSAWGLCARNHGATGRGKAKIGVLITSVREGGAADRAKPALSAGDILREVNGQPVASLAGLKQITEALLAGGKEQVAVTVTYLRGEDRLLTVVTLGADPTGDAGQEVRKAWLPVGMQVLNKDLAAALDLEGYTGVRVTRVYPNTAASLAGLQVGDIIIAVDGAAVEASQPEDTEVLPAMIRRYRINSTVELTILRGKAERKIAVTLPQAPRLPREMRRVREDHYEFTVRDVAFFDRIRNDWPVELSGVLIETVSEGGWAALGRLRAGDLLCAINGKPVTGTEQFESIMTAIAATQPPTIVLQIQRGEQKRFIELQGSWRNTGK